ncbi:MAG: glycosyltransferase [Proteobacteria bacterium]|nr:glycosyltransferase [Pseudomonadota bacterium]
MHTEANDKHVSDSAVVVIPAHNEAAFIGGTLDSVRRYGPPHAQVIVVDNGSTDDTAEIAATRGAKVVRIHSKLFPAAARNIGAETASPRSNLLVFLDADVELTPKWQTEWLAQIESLRANPMQITGAAYDISKQPSWIERAWFAPIRARKSSYIPGGNIVTTRALFSSLNGFDAKLETGEDVDFCIRARRLGASVIPNDEFKAHHEGFPKDIRHFIKRERWHGIGDLTTFQHAVRSRIVWATAIFVALHAFGIAAGVYAATAGSSLLPAWLCAAGIVALCMAGARRAVGSDDLPFSVGAAAIMYVYLLGRSLSMWDALQRSLFPTHSP